ncbi:MAG: PDZ domain-containing protein [Myxococcota bacterium]
MIDRSRIEKLADAAEGIPIWGGLPGSPAGDAGVRYGDILLSVNGHKTQNFSDYLEAKRQSDGTLELEILRESGVVNITIELAGSLWREFDEDMAEEVAEGSYFVPSDESSDESGDE